MLYLNVISKCYISVQSLQCRYGLKIAVQNTGKNEKMVKKWSIFQIIIITTCNTVFLLPTNHGRQRLVVQQCHVSWSTRVIQCARTRFQFLAQRQVITKYGVHLAIPVGQREGHLDEWVKIHFIFSVVLIVTVLWQESSALKLLLYKS